MAARGRLSLVLPSRSEVAAGPPASPKTPLSGSGSGSSGGRRAAFDVPRCPTCGNDSSARKFRYWLGGGGIQVWLCSAESTGRDGHGQTFCGRLFAEPENEARVRHCPGGCTGERTFDLREGHVGLYCSVCKVFVQSQ